MGSECKLARVGKKINLEIKKKIMKMLITMVLTTVAMLSLNANSATVTTQVQMMSYSNNIDGSISTIDYSNDGLVYTFSATWDDVLSNLEFFMTDSYFGFTDGYYGSDCDEFEPGCGSVLQSEYVTIDVSDGQINSFTATIDYEHIIESGDASTIWSYDGNGLIRTRYADYYFLDRGWSNDTLSYDVINPSAIPLPAGIYLFLSGLVGLGLIRRIWNNK